MYQDVLHVSFEYFPAAKAGGLADVVGALPKYMNGNQFKSAVVIPKHGTKWLNEQSWTEVYSEKVTLFGKDISFKICSCKTPGHPLFVVDVPEYFLRESIYINKDSGIAYEDEIERSICFQVLVLEWLKSMASLPKVLHCHDHHTGLIPFYTQNSIDYKKLKELPTVFTIHNGAYHGAFSWKKSHLLPAFDMNKQGLLDWTDAINPLATGIKCCWKLTTVSQGYMEELKLDSNGLENLIVQESEKSIGIINGIDLELWNPKTDESIVYKLDKDISEYKDENRKSLAKTFDVDFSNPIVTFIGRLAREKGVQYFPELIKKYLEHKKDISFLVLGTGDKKIEKDLLATKELFPKNFDLVLAYNEGLAHQLYAGSDFLIMPSVLEPCGLNQMYAMRYGTIPIVHSVGGLKDSVVDIAKSGGYGIRFEKLSVNTAFKALKRASRLYQNKGKLSKVLKRIMALDFSWENSAKKYKEVYKSISKIKN